MSAETNNCHYHFVGDWKLPGDTETSSGIVCNVLKYLNLKTVVNLVKSSFVKQLSSKYQNNAVQRHINELVNQWLKVLKPLYDKYERDFLRNRKTPFICACSQGRISDVMAFVNFHNATAVGKSLEAMVNQVGYTSNQWRSVHTTGLFEAVKNKHSNVVQYLLETRP